MSRDCERARQWASLDVDGELSTFEGVLLNAHAAGCADCREFRASVAHAASVLRTAPLEPFTVTVPSRVRRRISRSLAPAVAALAVVSVGLGSIAASSHIGLSHHSTPPETALRLIGTSLDTVNGRTLQAVQRIPTADPTRGTARAGGGPYVLER